MAGIVPVLGIAVTNEVHDVAAVGGLNDSSVAGLTTLSVAPIIELGNHVALVDILVQTAGSNAAGILRILLSQISEAFLSAVPLVKDGLSSELDSAVSSLLALGEVQVLLGDQNVADIVLQSILTLAAIEDNNIVSAGVLVKQDVTVTSDTALIISTACTRNPGTR